jgi:hypothetical protein
MAALEKASVGEDINPFADFLARLVEKRLAGEPLPEVPNSSNAAHENQTTLREKPDAKTFRTFVRPSLWPRKTRYVAEAAAGCSPRLQGIAGLRSHCRKLLEVPQTVREDDGVSFE